MSSAKEIAGRLPEREVQSIMSARHDGAGFRFTPGSARGVPIELKARSIFGHYLTPLGEEVRSILIEQKL